MPDACGAEVVRMATRLSQRSVVRYTNPHTRFAWPAQPPTDRFAMSPALSSLAGHPIYPRLTDAQKWTLHLREAVHFFSLNVAGERELMAGIIARLHGGALAPVAEYLHHFVHEENAHSIVFSRFCHAYGGGLYPDPQPRFARELLPGEDDVLFLCRVLVFEEIADHHNRAMAADDALWPLAREINAYHAEDEARHIAFGRRATLALWDHFAPAWPLGARAAAIAHVREFVAATLRKYVSVAVFRDAGLPADPYALRREVLASPAHERLAAEASRRSLAFVAKLEARG